MYNTCNITHRTSNWMGTEQGRGWLGIEWTTLPEYSVSFAFWQRVFILIVLSFLPVLLFWSSFSFLRFFLFSDLTRYLVVGVLLTTLPQLFSFFRNRSRDAILPIWFIWYFIDIYMGCHSAAVISAWHMPTPAEPRYGWTWTRLTT